MKDLFGIFMGIYLIKLPNKSHNIKHFWVAFFLPFKDLMKEWQILNFYEHFIYKNFVLNLKISRFLGFAGWIFNSDFIEVNGIGVGKRRNFWFFMRTFFIRANE